ncbi:MAG TPA: hypothetical protein VMU25_02490 [Candidatus Paceibacterota bacterium]|nr:hypothetical protein [Candidatus Paceibacterota bacterium]
MKIRIALVSALLAFVPLVASAQLGADTGSDAQCVPLQPVCGCHMVMQNGKCVGGANQFTCPCSQTDNGFTTSGICLADMKCHAQSTGGKSPDQGLSQLGQMLGQLMQQLMKAGQGGGGGGSGSPTGSTGTTCTTYTPTSDPTQVGINPCLYYVPSAASQITTGGITTGTQGSSANDLLNALGGSGSTGTTVSIGTATGGSSDTTGGNTTATQPSASLSQAVLTNIGALGLTASSTSQQGQGFASIPGVVGNILFNNNGATIYASTINAANNSALSGFYGSDTAGAQPQGVVASMCQNRPWASNFLTNFVPASFFDSLCQWGGYQVGQPPATQTPQVSLSQQHVPTQTGSTPTATVATSTGPTVPPQVQIWAVPASVTLGARTSVFWRTQGVTSCTETSPDGSFSQNTLQGAGATVPITAATTYTISCIDPSGNPVTGYVTVNLKI